MVVIDCYITNHCKTLWIKATIIYLFTVEYIVWAGTDRGKRGQKAKPT